MGVTLYMVDHTPDERKRTVRLTFVEMSFVLASAVATMISGALFKYFNFETVFGAALGLHLACVVYTIVFIKEKHVKKTATKVS